MFSDKDGIAKAALLYEESLRWYPTAEGFTYLGWMLSLLVCE